MLNADIIAAVKAVAKDYGWPWAALAALVEIESGGTVFAMVDGRREPLILTEYHIFDRYLSPSQQARARAAGLSHPRWGALKYPSSQAARWALLARWQKINREAALMACSWGLGQVMGFHWRALGYDSVDAMVARARSGIEGQIELMARYIHVNALGDDLAAQRWATVARGYNGPAYRTNKYDTKLAAAYRRYATSDGDAVSDGFLRMGAKGARVRALQTLLRRSGQAVAVDGDFGPATRRHLIAFQVQAGLVGDGVAGPKTWAALDAYQSAPDEVPGTVPVTRDPDVGRGLGAGGGAAIAVETAKRSIDDALTNTQTGAGLPDWLIMTLTMLSIALALAGIGYALWQIIDKRRTREAV